MAEHFDPYHAWLSIPPKDQPPHHYRLLGLELFEADADVTERAADRQRTYLRQHQNGPHSKDSQRLLNAVSQAALCLLNPQSKQAYDQQLKTALAPRMPSAAIAPIPTAPVLPVAVPVSSTVVEPRPQLLQAAPLPAAVPETVEPLMVNQGVRPRKIVRRRRDLQYWIAGIAIIAMTALVVVFSVGLLSSGPTPIADKPPAKKVKSTPVDDRTAPTKPGIETPVSEEPTAAKTSPTENSRKASTTATSSEPNVSRPGVDPQSSSLASTEEPRPKPPITESSSSGSSQSSSSGSAEPRSLSSLVEQAKASAAKETDRQLWAHANGLYERLADGSWIVINQHAKRIPLQETARNSTLVELVDPTNRNRVQLYEDHSRHFPSGSERQGAWYLPLAALPVGDAKADLERATAAYEAAVSKARADLEKSFEKELAAARKRNGKPDEKVAALKVLDEERARFARNGLVPWSLPMRDNTYAYLLALRKAAKNVEAAFDKVAEKAITDDDDKLAVNLAVLKRKTTVPVVVAVLEDNRSRSVRRFFANGHLDEIDSPWTWSIDKTSVIATGPYKGKMFVDRFVMSDDGSKYKAKNQEGTEWSGVVKQEP